MEPKILLAQFRALIERAPEFEEYAPTSREHLIWLAQAHALVSRWSAMEAIGFKSACDMLPLNLTRPSQVARILGTIHCAIADLELLVPKDAQVAFAAGEVYDFFRELNEVIASADSSLLIVDPYLDQSVFDHYLHSRKPSVSVRLLLSKNADDVKGAADKYTAQFGPVIEVRRSKQIHDRVIFVDDFVCWLVGQSLKDAAKAKPTYLAPLAPDVVATKLQQYNSLWDDAVAI